MITLYASQQEDTILLVEVETAAALEAHKSNLAHFQQRPLLRIKYIEIDRCRVKFAGE